MSVAVGDVVTPAAIFPYISTTTAAEALENGITVERPLLGRVSDLAPELLVDWNDGDTAGDTPALENDSLRFVGQADSNTVTNLRGKVVYLTGASQEFKGLVVSIFALEAGTTGKAGNGNVVTDDVVLFRTREGQNILALATSVEVVAGE